MNPDREKKLPEDLFDSYMTNEELIPSLDGKTVAITGTTSGLGFNIARCAITKNAALVLLLNRKSERSEKCEENLKKYLTEGSKTVIKTIDCDLMSFDSVKKAGGKTYVDIYAYNGYLFNAYCILRYIHHCKMHLRNEERLG